MFAYHSGALSGSLAYAATSARPRSIVSSVSTSTLKGSVSGSRGSPSTVAFWARAQIGGQASLPDLGRSRQCLHHSHNAVAAARRDLRASDGHGCGHGTDVQGRHAPPEPLPRQARFLARPNDRALIRLTSCLEGPPGSTPIPLALWHRFRGAGRAVRPARLWRRPARRGRSRRWCSRVGRPCGRPPSRR
jgi:hypothetical protein